jgi:hypothetical protein
VVHGGSEVAAQTVHEEHPPPGLDCLPDFPPESLEALLRDVGDPERPLQALIDLTTLARVKIGLESVIADELEQANSALERLRRDEQTIEYHPPSFDG